MTENDARLQLAWENLEYSVSTKNSQATHILNGISGKAHQNRLLAVMGASGAGKSTFLNALSARLLVDATHKLQGKTFINGMFYDERNQHIALVPQDDILLDSATPEEALYFSARVGNGLSKSEARQSTDKTLRELMLTDVKNVCLGTPGLTRGVSGGERKRTNIGVELITNPKVLLLDEPTSGLDSFTALRVVQLLQDLARSGKTVICTIHQPSTDIFQHFDDVMLMVDGKVVYHGAVADSLEYFSAIGYKCPLKFSPSDFFMALMQDDEAKLILIDEWEKCSLAQKDTQTQTDLSTITGEIRDSPTRGQSGFGVQFYELLLRSFRHNYRNRHLLLAQIGQSIAFGLFVGIVFYSLGDDQTSVQDRMGLFFLLGSNAVFAGAGNVINTFAVEKGVFLREQQSHAYSPLCYFLGKTLGELPFGILNSTVLVSIVYFLTGLTTKLSAFLLTLGVMILVYQSGVSFGLLLGALCPNFLVSAALLPLVLVPLTLAGGFAVSSRRLETYWSWMEKISPIRYTFIALTKIEFSNISHITCDETKFPGRCAYMFHTGMDVLNQLGFNSRDKKLWVMLVSLVGIVIVLRSLAVAALYRLSRKRT
ncbi:ABC transporter [Perkinsela sp. CCAP 1560/4]|nr:ABC transporter [Perkinsela sp. CCAP 1560/4]|eukprot:KNH09643.1 ABC transporter [Perkinsela sp. CCAP 1560/4]